MLETSLIWKSVLGEIELNVDPSIYATWFKKTRLLSFDNQKLIVGVPNAFAQRQLETQFQPLVKKALVKNKISDQDLVYRIISHASSKTEEGDSVQINNGVNFGKSSQIGRNRWAQAYQQGLNPKYTFETFITGSGNDLAHAACQAVVNNLGSKYNPLFVYGGVGIGKTHLIQAAGNAILAHKPQLQVVYVTIEQFVQEFTNAIRYKQVGDFTRCYRNADILIIDDIQFIANKEKTQEEFFHTFNVLHEAGKQIIISSDKPPHAIPTLEARLQSRFEMGMTIDMQIPDLETRCAILKAKADKINLKIESECVEFLASHISTNIRVLEGALNQLNAFCEAHQIVLATPQLAQQIFEKHFIKSKNPRITPKQVIEKVAQHYHLKTSELLSPKRDKDIVLPRQVAMYLLRQHLHLSYPRVAKSLNRKDHTTAIHSVDKIKKQILYNHELKEALIELKQALNL